MINVQKSDYLALQSMIERYRLQGLLEIIAYICGQMALRIREKYNDPTLAETWDKDATAIDNVRSILSN